MNDAWIFMSIGDAGGVGRWVTLRRLIGAADSNNHSIPTIEELEDTFSKLIAAGLVETRGTDARLTSAGIDAYRTATAKSQASSVG